MLRLVGTLIQKSRRRGVAPVLVVAEKPHRDEIRFGVPFCTLALPGRAL